MDVIVELIAIAVSINLALFGFWKMVVERWLDRRLADRAAQHARDIEIIKGNVERLTRLLQSQIDRVSLVHRVQFEKEFQLLLEIWERVSQVRRTMLAVRPRGGTAPLDETDDDRRTAFFARRRSFIDANNSLRAAVDDHEPFYDQDTFAALDQLLNVSSGEALDLQIDERLFSSEWYDNGARNAEALNRTANEVSVAIRSRLRALAVVKEAATE